MKEKAASRGVHEARNLKEKEKAVIMKQKWEILAKPIFIKN
jgi:hypothetical protein